MKQRNNRDIWRSRFRGRRSHLFATACGDQGREIHVRIVYDANAKSVGPSLNACLYTGTCLTPLLYDVLIRFRTSNIAVTADITRTNFYGMVWWRIQGRCQNRQVSIHPSNIWCSLFTTFIKCRSKNARHSVTWFWPQCSFENSRWSVRCWYIKSVRLDSLTLISTLENGKQKMLSSDES